MFFRADGSNCPESMVRETLELIHTQVASFSNIAGKHTNGGGGGGGGDGGGDGGSDGGGSDGGGGDGGGETHIQPRVFATTFTWLAED